MRHHTLEMLTRNERRRTLADENLARKLGEWGPWKKLEFPKGTVGDYAWLRDITICHRNKVFAVLEREAENGVRHLSVTSLSLIRPTWWEMQRIKNELAGEHATAVEVYPPQDEVVDGAETFHIWVLPEPLPFGLKERQS